MEDSKPDLPGLGGEVGVGGASPAQTASEREMRSSRVRYIYIT